MTFNPLSATKQIQESYVNFYKTNFSLGNKDLSDQLDKLSENNRLWREPFISISQNYISGGTLQDLQLEINLEDDLVKSLPISNLFKHQENAIRNITKFERNTIVSSGTGSGKTESFLIPVLNECTKSEMTGIKAILIYPMNALANDQVDRLRDILYKLNIERSKVDKRPITFGIYTGPTPETIFGKERKLSESLSHLSYRCPSCHKNTSLKCSEENGKGILTCKYESDLKIKFQLLSREELQNNPPDILITNYVMLERILVRAKDKPLFERNKVKFLVVDEMHAYGGARGVDVALLLRRFKRRLWKNSLEKQNIICIGTSATMSKASDPEIRKEKIKEFGAKLFGATFTNEDVFEGERIEWNLPTKNEIAQFSILDIPESLDNITNEQFETLCKQLSTKPVPVMTTIQEKSKYLGIILCENPFFQELIKNLFEPRSINELKSLVLSNNNLKEKLKESFDDVALEELIWSFLKAGSLAKNPTQQEEPLLKVGVHNFFRILPKIFMCSNPECGEIYFAPKDTCEKCKKKIEELAVCRNCSEEFFVSQVSLKEISRESSIKTDKERLLKKLIKAKEKENFEKAKEFESSLEDYKNKPIKRYSLSDSNESPEELWYKIIEESKIPPNIDDEVNKIVHLKKCLDCGSFNPISKTKCAIELEKGKTCNSKQLITVETFPPSSHAVHKTWRPRDCPYCNFSYGSGWAVTKFDMTPKQASTNLFNIAFEKVQNHKLLIFTDSRQDAAALAGWLDFAHEDTALKQLIIQKLQKLLREGRSRISYRELLFQELIPTVNDDWYNYNMEDFDRSEKEIEKKILLAITDKKRLAIERLGLIECSYRGLQNFEEFEKQWKSVLENYQFSRPPSSSILDILRLEKYSTSSMSNFITTVLNMMRRDEAIEGLEKRDWNEKFQAEGFDWDIHNEKITCASGTLIHNLASKRFNRFLLYTKKVFGVEENIDAFLILESVWNFIQKRGFIVRKQLMKFRRAQNPLAYVVAIDKLELSLPEKIQKCEQCNACFSNIPDNNCHTVIRHKLCPGATKEIAYNDFLSLKKDDHFFMLFKNGEPLRMVTKEHTGALSDEEKKSIQDSFSAEDQNERKVDVIVATPTLELGVDIGDLSSVGLYKSPPSSISYIQRVGRAGRRDGISFINTFFFNSPIDEYYFRNPQELIKGNFYPPYINFENEELIKRHFNSVILEEIALSDMGKILSAKVGEFIESREDNTKKILALIEKEKDTISEACRRIFDDIPEYKKKFEIGEKILEFKNDFKTGFDESLDYFKEELKSAQRALDEYQIGGRLERSDYIKLKELEKRRDELNSKKLDSHLFDVNFLPRFAFPGKLVEIEDTNGTFYHGGRPRNIAISEFAPNCEITWKKKIYKSVGIDPDKPPQYFNICSNCEKYYSSKEISGKTCPYCLKKIEEFQIRSISPTKIFIKEKSKTVTESSKYNEPKLDIFMPDLKHELIQKSVSLESVDVNLTKYGNTTMLLTVNEIFTEFADPEEELEDRARDQLQICDKCGKVKEWKSEPRHRPINKKFVGIGDRCSGQFLDAALHHEMPTNVISIKVKNKNDNQFVSNKKFLTTLKSALIYSGQSIAEAMEGEIEGVIKEDELLLFDNVDGGAGYVDIIFERFNEVLKRAYEIVKDEEEIYKEVCDKGCLRCLWSYRRKRDIPFIDKQLIYPLLQESSLLEIETEHSKKKPQISKFEKITSIETNLDAAKFVKKSIQKASKEIKIFTPIISDKKIDWPDDRAKGWIDILGSLRMGSNNVVISVFLKNRSNQDESTLRQLLAFDIQIFEINDDYFEKYELDSNYCKIVIDPYTEQRECLKISSNLTDQIIKDYTNVYHSKDEKTVEQIKKDIEKISSYSKKISSNDLVSLDNIDIDTVLPNNKESLSAAILKLNNFISTTQKSIKIIDPYLQNDKYTTEENLRFYLSYLIKFLKKGISIQILSTGHEKSNVLSLKTYFKELGYDLEIVSFNLTGFYKNRRIIHDRYVIIDDKEFVELGKGLTIIFEFEKKGYLNNSISITYNSNIKNVRKILKDSFEYYWNYQTCPDQKIKNWPKTDTRFLK